MTRIVRSAAAAAALWLSLADTPLLQGQAEKAAPLVTVEAVIVEPSGRTGGAEAIGPGTLCKLRVKLRNAGTQKAFSFLFGVKVNGREVSTYDKTVYTQAIDPGTTGELELYNFYSSEPGGPTPKDGNLTVEITLKEARWVELKKDGQAGVWTPVGDVKGLPSKAVVKTIKLTK